jgi:hypothetical protein
MANTDCLTAISHSLTYLVHPLLHGLVSPIEHLAWCASNWNDRQYCNGDKRASNLDCYQCVIYTLNRVRKHSLRRDIDIAVRVRL